MFRGEWTASVVKMHGTSSLKCNGSLSVKFPTNLDGTSLNTAVWNLKSDTNNNRGKWNHLRIIQTITERHTWKARHQETTDNSRIWHSTHTSEETNEKYTTFIMANSITCIVNSNVKIATALYTLETWFVSGI